MLGSTKYRRLSRFLRGKNNCREFPNFTWCSCPQPQISSHVTHSQPSHFSGSSNWHASISFHHSGSYYSYFGLPLFPRDFAYKINCHIVLSPSFSLLWTVAVRNPKLPTSSPVSSDTSRSAHASKNSPNSRWPPGRAPSTCGKRLIRVHITRNTKPITCAVAACPFTKDDLASGHFHPVQILWSQPLVAWQNAVRIILET